MTLLPWIGIVCALIILTILLWISFKQFKTYSEFVKKGTLIAFACLIISFVSTMLINSENALYKGVGSILKDIVYPIGLCAFKVWIAPYKPKE